ncbi:MAG TPA: CBS domain-containing protein [Polyangia bacterium]|nr:CBS domain-containing protein [Polyangia bacterium]
MPRRFRMNQGQASPGGRWPAMLGGIGLGSALFYFLDPNLGRRRRAHARDKAIRAARLGRRDVVQIEQDLSNRAHGLLARLRARLRSEAPDDEILKERARAAIGHICSHPRGIEVSVNDGRVLLSGPMLEKEHDGVIRHVARIHGVRAVEDALKLYARADGVPSLQGDRSPSLPWTLGPACCADLMKTEVQIIGENDSIHRAAEVMALANVGCLPVCNLQRKVIGTITDRDIVVRVVADNLPTTAFRVSDAMTGDVITCRPEDEITLAEQLMAQHQVSRIPITDDDGTLLGIISLSDVAEHESIRRAGRTLRAISAREAPRA